MKPLPLAVKCKAPVLAICGLVLWAGNLCAQTPAPADPAYHARADLLSDWCEQRRQMELQTRYHHWLHAWLLVHVPASFLLIILTGWHAVAEVFLY